MDLAVSRTGAPTYDLELDASGKLYTVDRSDQTAQALTIRLKTQKREWAFDETMGLDWRGRVLVRAPDLRTVNGLLVAEINRVRSVRRLTRLELDNDPRSRSLSASFDVETIFDDFRTVSIP